MKVIVTGGSGYLGTHIRRRLRADSLSRREGVDILKPAGPALLEPYDAVVHMAASLDKSPAAAEGCFAVNVQGTLNILAHLRPGQGFVFTSTKDVYGNHALRRKLVSESCPTSFVGQSAYEWSKLIAEKYIEYHSQRLNLHTAIFRLSTTYAPLSEGNAGSFVNFFAGAVRNGTPIRLKARGKQVRDLLHVDDLSDAIRRFLRSGVSGGIFNIGGGPDNRITLLELVNTFSTMLGKDPVLELSPEKETGQMRFVSDIEKARRVLGWHPRIGLKRGLKSVLS
jgi:nucleoside-diphosphate-sugar epimerase